ncbi:peroxiredoxin family protein [Paraconexibacter sp.]|uniref:peroxiredoxin family protein n=1 Tax=Paraconexibacter sp. TaxID=2949640 RepID=UPI00356840C5
MFPAPRVARRSATAAAIAVVVAGLSACGGAQEETAPQAAPAATGAPQDFPRPEGRSLADLEDQMPEGPILSPSVTVLDPGRNRYGFGLFDTARKQLRGAKVALYLSRSDGSGLRGPFVARSESLKVGPQFQSRQTAQDPDTTNNVYVADVDFPSAGAWALTAVARLDGRLVRTGPSGVKVGRKGSGPPEVGDPAPRVHTPTVQSVGGDLESIDTRVPPLKSLHQHDLAEVLGKDPVVLVFATPQLCQSRVCGPVVDVAAEVQDRYGRDVRFIHMEIYRDNDLSKGFRSQVAAYRLPTEPWTFVIDRQGIVRERFEGAFSVGELERAVAKVR